MSDGHEILRLAIQFSVNFRNRSSDSAKYTNKSSGTSVRSGNYIQTTSFHPKFYTGSKHHRDGDRQSLGNINTAPVHKKVVANPSHNDTSNHIINRFINNNTQAYNNHYSLSLNRHAENHNAKLGVGCISTLTSPYAGMGVEKLRGTKSDIGVPAVDVQRRVPRAAAKNSILHKSTLSSVHSDMSIYEATFTGSHFNMNDANNDLINNNNLPMTSAITFSKTGSKLLYSNKHRLNPLQPKVSYDSAQAALSAFDANANKFGPLLYKNGGGGLDNGNWKNSVYDNSIRSVS